jgi:predicted anti-sigma-YlaC factor YlaD
MDDHVTEWLGAHLDGELHRESQQRVKNHLLTCTACQEELASLQSLSDLLQEMPAVENVKPTSQFVTQLLLYLPPRPQPLSNRILRTVWNLLPVILLAALVFFQTVYVVNGLVMLVGQTGLFGASFTWLMPISTQGVIAIGTAYLLNVVPGPNGQALIGVLRGGEWLNNTILIPLSIQVMLMLLFASWLASWFARRSAIPNGAGER